MDAIFSRNVRQAFYYVYVALKLLVGIASLPLLVLLFRVWERGFLAAFTFLWPHLDILDDDGLYLRRWFMTPKTKWFHPRFLHLINRSDVGRAPHDHPGAFATRILRRAYDELVYKPKLTLFRQEHGLCIIFRRNPGTLLHNPEGHTHMVSLVDGPVWTWVTGWIRGKPWGFWELDPYDANNDRWIDSEVYGVKGHEVKSWEIRT